MNTPVDVINGNDGLCSLREAVIAANTNLASGPVVGECAAGTPMPAVDLIKLPVGNYLLTLNGPAEDAAATGDLDILESVTVHGTGPTPAGQAVFGSVGWDDRIFHVVTPSASVTLSRMLITGGRLTVGGGTLRGGGIYNQGNLTLREVLVTNNAVTDPAGDVRGGGIANEGNLDLFQSQVAANQANGAAFQVVLGGGIYSEGPGLTQIVASEITGNTSARGGGGIWCYGDCSLLDTTVSSNHAGDNAGGVAILGGQGSISNSTITLNTAAGSGAAAGGGGVVVDGIGGVFANVTLLHSTIVGNGAANGKGGGLFLGGAPSVVTLRNTILAANNALDLASGPDCIAFFGNAVSSLGGNLIGDNSGCGLVGLPSDQVGLSPAVIDPLVLPLAANGGPTPTRMPAVGSPAIDAAAAGGCSQTDQRGYSRPAGGVGCDIGAVEVGAVAPVTGAPTINSAVPPGGTVGAAYSFLLSVFGTNPISFDDGGTLPPGLALDPVSGIITGTPTVAGSYNVTLTAANGIAPNASQSFVMVIGGAGGPVVSNVPTLSEWGLLLLASLLMFVVYRQSMFKDHS